MPSKQGRESPTLIVVVEEISTRTAMTETIANKTTVEIRTGTTIDDATVAT